MNRSETEDEIRNSSEIRWRMSNTRGEKKRKRGEKEAERKREENEKWNA